MLRLLTLNLYYIDMEENPKKTDIQKLNEALFPLVYGFTSQSNTLAKELFDLAV